MRLARQSIPTAPRSGDRGAPLPASPTSRAYSRIPPICCITVRTSKYLNSSISLPSSTRKTSTPPKAKRFPLGATPVNSPCCVPWNVNRLTTVSAISSSTVQCSSGATLRCHATKPLCWSSSRFRSRSFGGQKTKSSASKTPGQTADAVRYPAHPAGVTP